MKDNLVQSLADYIAELETRLEENTKQDMLNENRIKALEEKIRNQEERMAILAERVTILAERQIYVEPKEMTAEKVVAVEEIKTPEPVTEEIPEAHPETIEQIEDNSDTATVEEVNTEEIADTEATAEETLAPVQPEEQPAENEDNVVFDVIPEAEVPNKEPKPVQGSLFGQAVDDVRHVISLGDRFLFQKELFGKNPELMQKTLDAINAKQTLAEALEYIDSHFDWDKESTAYELFANVLKRRFN